MSGCCGAYEATTPNSKREFARENYQFHHQFLGFGIPRRKNEEKSIFLALRRSLREDYQEVFLSYVFGPISFHVSSNQSDGRLFVL